MNNEPVAWMLVTGQGTKILEKKPYCEIDYWKPLYTHQSCKHGVDDGACKECYQEATHPVKELTNRIAEQEKFIKAILKKGGCDGNICQKYNTNPVKELTDEEIMELSYMTSDNDPIAFVRAILRKAQEK